MSNREIQTPEREGVDREKVESAAQAVWRALPKIKSEIYILKMEVEKMTLAVIEELLQERARNVVICMMDEIERLGWGKADE